MMHMFLWLYTYVASVYVASVLSECCICCSYYAHMFKMFHLFQTYVAEVLHVVILAAGACEGGSHVRGKRSERG
jgi:general stress protein CsbA